MTTQHECEYTSICCEVGVAEGTELGYDGRYQSDLVVGICGSCRDSIVFECIMCEEALQKE